MFARSWFSRGRRVKAIHKAIRMWIDQMATFRWQQGLLLYRMRSVMEAVPGFAGTISKPGRMTCPFELKGNPCPNPNPRRR